LIEIDIEAVPWKDAVVAAPPRIDAGDLLIPTARGWERRPTRRSKIHVR
jgi:hypothetical protein